MRHISSCLFLNPTKYTLNFVNSLAPPPPLMRTSSEIKIDELGLKGSSKLWIGKDYVNFIVKDFVDLHNPFEGEF